MRAERRKIERSTKCICSQPTTGKGDQMHAWRVVAFVLARSDNTKNRHRIFVFRLEPFSTAAPSRRTRRNVMRAFCRLFDWLVSNKCILVKCILLTFQFFVVCMHVRKQYKCSFPVTAGNNASGTNCPIRVVTVRMRVGRRNVKRSKHYRVGRL